MNKAEIKQIILEEIEAALNEMASPEHLAADSRPEDDDIDDGPEYEDLYGADVPPFITPEEYARRKLRYAEKQGKIDSDYIDDLDEMARTSNVFKLSQEASMKDVLQFMQRVNDVLKTYKSPGQKRPKKRFTPEEMKALATAMVNPDGFTSKDIIANTSYNSPAQANKFLKALEMKGLITLTSQLKKSMEPTRDPDAPETRGRKRRDSEFDMPDDALDMDFGDFDNLDLSDPLAEIFGLGREKGEPKVRFIRYTKAAKEYEADDAPNIEAINDAVPEEIGKELRYMKSKFDRSGESEFDPDRISTLPEIELMFQYGPVVASADEENIRKGIFGLRSEDRPRAIGVLGNITMDFTKQSEGITGGLMKKIAKIAVRVVTLKGKLVPMPGDGNDVGIVYRDGEFKAGDPSIGSGIAPGKKIEITVDENMKTVEVNFLAELPRSSKYIDKGARGRFQSDMDADFNNPNLNRKDTMSELEKYIKKQIKEAKNPLATKMKEIETQGRVAALETKLAAVAEMIEETEGRLTRIDEDNEFRDMMDKNAVKEVRKQLKELERAQAKLQKEYDKVSGGRKKEKVVDELDAEETRAKADKFDDLADRQDALDQEAGEVEEVSFELNESVKRMQKLANILKG
jgi:hypothetical protein